MRGLSLIDIPFLTDSSGMVPLSTGNILNDDIESYGNGMGLAGKNLGINGTHTYVISWASAYFVAPGLTGILVTDDMELYTNGANLDTLNFGNSWSGAFVDR